MSTNRPVLRGTFVNGQLVIIGTDELPGSATGLVQISRDANGNPNGVVDPLTGLTLTPVVNPVTGQVDNPATQDALRGPTRMTSGAWMSVPAFCQVVLTGSGLYTYDTQNAAGAVTTNVGSGNAPDTVPIYMGGATKLRFNFPNTATAKVN